MQGTDGIEGAVELHAAGGLIVIQDLETCEFQDMPASVRAAIPDAVSCAPELSTLLRIQLGS